MDINQLNCFISVAQTLNFSEAARRNYVSQSTVSRYISDLEKEFGVKLFTRSHRDVIITSEGKILLTYAQEIVSSLKKAKTVINQMREGGQGKIKIGCDITSMHSISGGEYDFCFMPRDMVPESSEIETISTHTDSLLIVKAVDRKKRELSLSDISNERLLMMSEAAAPILYMEIMDLLRTFHVSPKSEITFDDLASLYIAISSGMGVSVLPRSVADFTSDKHISRRVIGEADTGIAYVMAWSKNIRNSAAELFIETVRKLSQDEDNVYGI